MMRSDLFVHMSTCERTEAYEDVQEMVPEHQDTDRSESLIVRLYRRIDSLCRDVMSLPDFNPRVQYQPM